ncbi:MAG: hypothetical protein HY826_13580 [Actinobacteria bacterium]|nr:hypothetical protein [Actinomycetota bacterium]
MSTAQTVDSFGPEVGQLLSLVQATSEVREHLDLVDSARFGNAIVLQAAVADLEGCVEALAEFAGGSRLPSLRALEQTVSNTPNRELAMSLASTVRSNIRRISEQSDALAIELRQLLADTRDVLSVATGSTGTYDSHGRTTVGQLRRDRGLA